MAGPPFNPGLKLLKLLGKPQKKLSYFLMDRPLMRGDKGLATKKKELFLKL